MSESLFGPATFGSGGARWNPFASPNDAPHMQVAHAVLDVVVALRGATPNLALDDVDSFIWAGEWELALGTIEAVIETRPQDSSELAETMLKRAQLIWASHNPGNSQ